MIRQPRRDRLGADFARVWARELVLGNPYAKAVLLAVANYMNEDGTAWPGSATIARDTDLSEETVIKRLRWLESIGALALFKTWRDEHGRRNFEGRGKPSANEIRFLFDADIDAIEAAAHDGAEPRSLRGAALKSHQRVAGEEEGDQAESSPRHPRELDSDQPPTSPRLAPCQPPPPAESPYIDSEPEPEVKNPPNPPSGGVQATIDQELEGDIAEFAKLYPSPITNLPRLRTVLSAMAHPERAKVLLAVKGYREFIADCERKKKPRAVKDADRWVSSGMWQGYVSAGERSETVAQRISVPADSIDGRAWANLRKVGNAPAPLESCGMYTLPRPLTAQERAFAELPPESDWSQFEVGKNVAEIGAWTEFIAGALTGINRGTMTRERGVGGERKRIVTVPWPWPPAKDGRIYATGPPVDDITDQDIEDMSKFG